MEREKETVQDRFEKISVRIFTIAGCPEETFQRFMRYCDGHAKNVKLIHVEQGKPAIRKEELIYHFGLKQLLDVAERNAVTTSLFKKMLELEGKFEELELHVNQALEKPVVEQKRVIKTGGGHGVEVKNNGSK